MNLLHLPVSYHARGHTLPIHLLEKLEGKNARQPGRKEGRGGVIMTAKMRKGGPSEGIEGRRRKKRRLMENSKVEDCPTVMSIPKRAACENGMWANNQS